MALKQYLNRFFAGRLSNNEVYAEYYRRTSSANKIEWKRSPDLLQAKEIKDWKVAVAAATNPDDPRRGLLKRFYDSLMLDSHLMSVIDTRILRVQRSSFMVADSEGKENEELTKLLQRPWFDELIRLVLMSRFQGITLIEMFDLDTATSELATVTEIPQSNVITTEGIVVREEYDSKGVSYTDEPLSNYYLQIGGNFDLGMFNQLAMPVLAKKLAVGSWMSYIDKYGVPPIFFITDRMDTARRDELFEMGENFRQNMFAVLQGNEKIETPQAGETNAHLTFESLIENYCNKEISKRVLGGTSSTDEKAFVGSAEVQERVANNRYEADKQLFRYIFNQKIRQRLVKLSPIYQAFESHTLVWDNSETLDINEYIDAVSKLSNSFEFDIEEIKTRTGLPVTGVRKFTHPLLGPDTGDDEPPTQKKKPDSTKAVASTTLPTAATWDKSVEELVEQIYQGTLVPEELNRNLVLRYYNGLNTATQKGWGGGYYSHENKLTRKFRESLLTFSGAKTYSLIKRIEKLKEASPNKEEFLQNAKRTVYTHNDIWQKTEEKFASNSASAANHFYQFQKDSDIYPNLRYVTMQDPYVRESHAKNDGLIKPVNEWTIMPPLDYGCRCYLEQTTEPPTDGRTLSKYNTTIAGNPALSGKIYSENHSYNKRVSELPKDKSLELWQNKELMKQYMPYHAKIQSGENFVHINDFADYDNDLTDNLKASKKIAKELKIDVYIRPHIHSSNGVKNPEFGIGNPNILADLKRYGDDSSSIDSFLSKAIAKSNRQKCMYTVCEITEAPASSIQNETIKRLVGSLGGNINRMVQQVIFIRGDRVFIISRKQIKSRDFSSINELL